MILAISSPVTLQTGFIYYFYPMYQVGDIVNLKGTGIFADGIDCEVLEVSSDGEYIRKMKAVQPNEDLARHGFFREVEDYVSMPFDIISPN